MACSFLNAIIYIVAIATLLKTLAQAIRIQLLTMGDKQHGIKISVNVAL